MRGSLLAMLMLLPVVSAQPANWILPGTGNYSVAGNWNPAAIPGPTANVEFNIASSYSVNFTTSITNATMFIGTGNVTFSLNGNTYTTTAATNTFISGGNNPSWTVFGGNLNLGSFGVGTGLGNVGTVRFGSGVTATIGNNFTIGGNGLGTVLVESGADVVNSHLLIGTDFTYSSGSGYTTLSGAGSTWSVNGNCRIGEYSTGSLVVQNAAAFTCSVLEVGAFPGAMGTITVGGNNASFTSNGTANLGGFLPSNPGTLASLIVNAGGSATFNGALNLRSSANITINGGTLNVNNSFAFLPGATASFLSGTVQFANASTLTTDAINLFLNGSGVLGVNRTLAAVNGTASLATPFVVAGTLNLPDTNLNASLIVQPLGRFSSTGIITLNAGQTLQVENLGTLHADTALFNNGGTISLGGTAAIVTGFTANNFGIVQGTGRFAGGLNNGTGGFLRANTGHHIIIDQVGPTNNGNIELAGGTLEYTKVLSNLGSGFISGRGEFRGGTSSPGGNGLSNLGVVALSAGFTDIRGDVINSGNGKVIAAGGAVVTFYDDVTHNGVEIRTQMGARSVFFGAQSGAGPFTGTGIVEYSGDLRPGNSPALVTHEGTVILNSTATFKVEIGGPAAGSDYDQLRIAGGVLLGGHLNVSFLNGYTPPLGSQFRIIDFTGPGPVDGTFNGLPENSLFDATGTLFQINYAAGTGNDVVLTVVPVPEPATGFVLLVGLVLLRQRRT